MEHLSIQSLLDTLIEKGDGDLIFSHILSRLSPSYIISSSPVSDAFACLLSRASEDELLKLLPNGISIAFSNVAHPKSSPTIPTSKQSVSRYLSNIACNLSLGHDDGPNEVGDLKLCTQKYWQIDQGPASLGRIEHNPAQRFKYLSDEESRILASIKDLHCRDRLVKILKENERQIASWRFRDQLRSVKTTDIQIQTLTNEWIAKQLGIDVKRLKGESNVWRKLLDIMEWFDSPGILRILGGSSKE